ncbi:HNH endonuclease [Alcaligenes sp. YSL9]|uniref:HNH endonuclease n=1 Tax=Alcaligenes sp. YSL9 TaxID=2939596 RepID=UPI00349F6996
MQQIRKRAGRLGLSVPLKRWTQEEDAVIRDSWGSRELASVAQQLGRSVSETASRAKRIGCVPWRKRKGTHAGRPIDGFVNGKPVYSHRTVVEKSLGRRLSSDEIVHHIDANKFNNSSANLYVFKSRAAHRKAHSSFESIIPALLERGIIVFDSDRGIYRLCEIHK